MIEILRLQFQITISFKNKIRFENNSFLSPKNTNLEKLNFWSLKHSYDHSWIQNFAISFNSIWLKITLVPSSSTFFLKNRVVLRNPYNAHVTIIEQCFKPKLKRQFHPRYTRDTATAFRTILSQRIFYARVWVFNRP